MGFFKLRINHALKEIRRSDTCVNKKVSINRLLDIREQVQNGSISKGEVIIRN